jgi:hypothetical protein
MDRKPVPVIVRLADGVYAVEPGDSLPLALTDAEDRVLLAFLRRPAMSLGELVDRSGTTHAPRILARLIRKHPEFAPCIRLPGRRGRGGYAVRILDRGPPLVQNRASIAPRRPADRKSQWGYGPLATS